MTSLIIGYDHTRLRLETASLKPKPGAEKRKLYWAPKTSSFTYSRGSLVTKDPHELVTKVWSKNDMSRSENNAVRLYNITPGEPTRLPAHIRSSESRCHISLATGRRFVEKKVDEIYGLEQPA